MSAAPGQNHLRTHAHCVLNGLQVDEAQFRRDVARLVKGAQAAHKSTRTTTVAAR